VAGLRRIRVRVGVASFINVVDTCLSVDAVLGISSEFSNLASEFVGDLGESTALDFQKLLFCLIWATQVLVVLDELVD